MDKKQHWSLEDKRSKYKGYIKEERTNFFFLRDGSMVYPCAKFDGYWDALIDAIKNHGEDIDDMVSLVFKEKIDQPMVKAEILKELKAMGD